MPRIPSVRLALLLLLGPLARPTVAQSPVPDGGAAVRVGSAQDATRCPLVLRWRTEPHGDKALAQLHAKDDVFPEEAAHEEIRPRVDALRQVLLNAPARGIDLQALLDPSFAGARLQPTGEDLVKKTAGLELRRAKALPAETTLDAKAFGVELAAWMSDYRAVTAADLDVVQVDLDGPANGNAVLLVDFDVTGAGSGAARVQKTGQWRQTWRKDEAGAWRLLRWQGLAQTRGTAARPLFVEATEAALGANASLRQQLDHGADDWRRSMDIVVAPDVSSHSGIAAGDIDGDGFDDLYVSQPSGLPNRLFRNRGDGTFEDVTEESGVGLLDATPMSLFADVDNDGDQDLIVITWTQPLLFMNDGKGHFTLQPGAFKFATVPEGTLISAAMADYDRDGYLDLYLATYNYFVGRAESSLPSPYHDAQNSAPKYLFHNDGHGHFVDVTLGSGIDQHNNRYSLAPAWADYDGDGWPDLYVANDFGRHSLYHNLGAHDGRVTFEEVGAKAGVEDVGAGMSSAWFDYDNDGRLDLYVANMWSAAGQRLTRLPAFQPQATGEVRAQLQRHAKGNSLFRNRGDGTFEDVSLSAHVNKARWAWASDALDFDNDGWEDVYSTNGMITNPDPDPALGDLDSFYWRRVVGQSPLSKASAPGFEASWTALIKLLGGHGAQAAHERNVFFANLGGGDFVNAEGVLGLDVDQDARAFAISDFDHDGDLDVAVKARTGPQLRYFRNDTESGNGALAIRLVGVKSNRDAVGAIVRVETDHGRYTKTIQCGSGYLSERSKELLFGLGTAREVRTVTIAWPSGLVQTLKDVPADRRVTVTEGDDHVVAVPFRKKSEPSARPALVSEDADRRPLATGTWLYDAYPAPDFALPGLAGGEYALSSQSGHPLLVHFWSPACAPCQAEVRALSREATAIEGAGAAVWAIAVDGGDPAGRAAAEAFAQKEKLAMPVLLADADVVAIYSLVARHLFDYTEDLFVPTTLLIDGHGQIAKIYRGPIGAGQAVADVQALEAPEAERLARAVPFKGRFLTPTKARSDFQIGMELAEHGYDTPALVAFERAAATAPDAFTHYNLGTLYMKRGERARAEVALRRALALRDDYPDADNSLGVLLAQRERFDEAIVHFQAALKARPGFADAMNNLGFTYLQLDQADEALKLFQAAVQAQPEFPEAYNNLGIFYGQDGDLGKAASFFQRAVELRPTYSEAVNNLAMVYAAQGKAKDAVDMLQRCLAADPGFEMTYVVLGRILLQAGQRTQAMGVLQQLLARNPKNEAALQLFQQAQSAPAR